MMRLALLGTVMLIACNPPSVVIAQPAPTPPPQAATAGRTTWSFDPYVVRCDIPVEMPPAGLPGVSPADPTAHTLEDTSVAALLTFELAVERHGEVGASHTCIVYDNTHPAERQATGVEITGTVLERYVSDGRSCVHTRNQVAHKGAATATDDARYCQALDGFFLRMPSA